MISFALDCDDVPTDVFIPRVDRNVLSLTLDTQQNDIADKSFSCKIRLTDSMAAKNTYAVAFENLCFKFNGNSTFKLTQLRPTIRNVSSSGEVLVSWNERLVVPSAGNR